MQEIVEKIKAQLAPDAESPLAKLCDLTTGTVQSFEQYLAHNLWDDTLARKLKDMEQKVLAESQRLLGLCDKKHAAGESSWKAGLSAESTIADVLDEYVKQLDDLDGKNLRKGIKVFAEAICSKRETHRCMYVCVLVFVFVVVFVYLYLYVCTCMYVFVFVLVFALVFVCMDVCMYVCKLSKLMYVCVCVHVRFACLDRVSTSWVSFSHPNRPSLKQTGP